ncbi:hypothetical protein [Halobacillus ihumii]|nr:hypothetical protein [Halobacillus ihumii]
MKKKLLVLGFAAALVASVLGGVANTQTQDFADDRGVIPGSIELS